MSDSGKRNQMQHNIVKKSDTSAGFTLLELIVSMALMMTLVAMLWALVQLYANYFAAGTHRAERSQLVRSISQLMSEDLGAAIQDPVHTLSDPMFGDDSVRRFGLSGTSTSLRIDVVQINPAVNFKNDAAESGFSIDNSRQAVLGPVYNGQKVPELKTVYYDFVSLAEPPNPGNVNDKLRPGLTRRELSFETPDGTVPSASWDSDFIESGFDQEIPQIRAVGTSEYSQIPQPDLSNAFAPNYLDQTAGASVPVNRSASISEQLTRESDENTMWAPEVVDCRFRYSDGNAWLDSWDSIAMDGLPVAIEVSFKLMTIDDVEKIRRSPLLVYTAKPPTPETAAEDDFNAIATARAVGTSSMSNSEGMPIATSMTLEAIADEIGLIPPVRQRIVAYLATSALNKNEPIQRPSATVVKSGPTVVPIELPQITEPKPVVLPSFEPPPLAPPSVIAPTTPPVPSPTAPPTPKPKTQEWIRK